MVDGLDVVFLVSEEDFNGDIAKGRKVFGA